MRELSEDVESLFTENPSDQAFEKVGVGNNRVVYRIRSNPYGLEPSEYVVKVSRTGVENREECRVWRELKDTDFSDNLVPVTDYSDDFTWIVMPFHSQLKPELVSQELYDVFSEHSSDVSKTDFVENRETGRQMCCDYATLTVDEIR